MSAFKWSLFFLVLLSLTVSFAAILSPYIIGDFIDQLATARDTGFIYRHFALFAIINLVSLGLGYISERLYTRLQTLMGFALNRAYIQKLQYAQLSFTGRRDTAYLNQRINNDANRLIVFCLGLLMSILKNIVVVATTLTIMFLFHPALAGILLGVGIMYFIFYTICKQMLYKANLAFEESRSIFFSKLNEQLFSIRFVKLHALFIYFIDRLNNGLDFMLTSALRYQKASYIFSSLDRLVYIAAQMVLLLVGGREIIAGRLTIGQFIIISAYFNMMLGAIRYFFSLGQTVQSNMVSYNRLRELDSATAEPNGQHRLSSVHSIELVNVNFAYGERPVLANANHRFVAGKIYAILGPNGAGKSTLADVIIGLQAGNYTGQVLYNGRDDIDMYDLRNRLIGVSEQEPTLLADTLANNIVLDKPDLPHASSDLMERLVDILGLKAYFASLVDGLGTQINESAANLSGGEKQKLSILRALVKAPDVIVLDEPTSALDTNSKTALMAYLNEVKRDKIIIVITHDAEFVDEDMVIVQATP